MGGEKYAFMDAEPPRVNVPCNLESISMSEFRLPPRFPLVLTGLCYAWRMSQPKARKMSEATLKQFNNLLLAVRKEHSKNGRRASAATPTHQAALQFAEINKIPGAKALLDGLLAIWTEENSEAALAEIRNSEKDLPPLLRGHFLDIKGLLLGNLQNWDESIQSHKEALENPNYETKAYALHNMGVAYTNIGQYDRGIELSHKALQSPDFDAKGRAFNSIGYAYSKKGDYGKAVEFFHQAIEVPDYDLKGVTLNNLGIAHSEMGNFDNAILFFEKAQESGDFDGLNTVINNLGVAYGNKGAYDISIEYYKQGLNIPDKSGACLLLNNLGNAYANKREYEKAFECFRKALQEPTYSTPHLTSNNLANAFRENGQFEEALNVLNQVLVEPDTEGQHARARDIKRLIEEAQAGMEPSVAEESLAKAGVANADETYEQMMLKRLGNQDKGRKDKYDEYLLRDIPEQMDGFTCLRGWSSAVTLLEGGKDCHWTGGGYFLRWQGKGIVIDPGFDFMDNFHDANLHLKEVDAVLVSHNHSDHNYDLSSLDDLRYELHTRSKKLEGDDKKHAVSKCLFVVDEDTAQGFRHDSAQHRGRPLKFDLANAEHQMWFTNPQDLPIIVEHFEVQHGKDVPNAIGMKIRLGGHDSKEEFVLGYTGDTRWFPKLGDHLQGCDVLLAHISMPSDEELLDDADYEGKRGKSENEGGFKHLPLDGFKATHLGYRGMIELISRTQPKMVLVGEFWAGLADLRIDLVKGLRSQVKKRTGKDIPILPTGLGLRLRLPSLEVECTSCSKLVTHSDLKIAPAANPFGPLSYLCPKCLG